MPSLRPGKHPWRTHVGDRGAAICGSDGVHCVRWHQRDLADCHRCIRIIRQEEAKQNGASAVSRTSPTKE